MTLMTPKIEQHSPEWYEIKLPKIGSSDIFSIAEYYCKDELKQANINLVIGEKNSGELIYEKPFSTALEIYLRVKFGVQNNNFLEVNNKFGLGMEDFIIHYSNRINPNLITEKTNDFIIWDENNLACCSPDSYVEIKQDIEFKSNHKGIIINRSRGKGIRELKTANYGFNFKKNDGTRYQYIFQHQYQLLVKKVRWGSIDVLTPKEANYDTDFFKGRILGRLDYLDYDNVTVIDKIISYYDLNSYIFPEIKTIQNLCVLALHRFQKALDNNILPNLSIDNIDRLTRERKLLSLIKPEKYGLINARKDEELNGLINELKIANNEIFNIRKASEFYKCELIQKMGNHIGIIGKEWTWKYAINGSLRFSQTKNEK